MACYEAANAVEEGNNKFRLNHRVKSFALWVANYALTALLSRFGEKMEEVQRDTAPRKRTVYTDLFAELAVTFTSDDLRASVKRAGSRSPIRHIIYRWHQNGMIAKVEGVNGVYKKITNKKDK